MQTEDRYVIGMDSSTQSTKAIAWNRDGTPAAEGRAPHPLSTPEPDFAEQDAADWWRAACTALRAVTAGIDPARIDGLAISNQRETMVFLDPAGRPLAPATVWLDSRAKAAVKALAGELGAERLHTITGKPVDITPCVYRLRHFREHAPELLDRAAQILSVQDFLTLNLTGTATASWTSAGPFGIFDITRKEWSREILDHLAIPVTKLPRVQKPGSRAGAVTAAAAAATGLREGTPVYVAGGDGACAGLGVNVIHPGVVYLNLGTALAGGVWSATPELSRYWRTLISPSGEGYLLETVQRAGAFFLNWLIDNFGGGRADPAIFSRLEAQAAELGIGSGGVTACSYLVGCMDPHWDLDARATFTGMGPETTLAHLYRASVEAITLEFSRALAEMRAHGAVAERIFAIGGGAQSPLWRSMVADATGLPVVRSLSTEASALGAGMAAAVGAGWYADFAAAAAAMSRHAEQIDPRPEAADAWAALSRKQAGLYHATRPFS